MDLREGVEKVDEQLVRTDEGASYKRVRKVGDCDGIVVYAKDIIDLKFFPLDLVDVSLFCSKDPDKKLAIVHVGESELAADCVLLDLVALDALVVLAAANRFLHDQLVSLQTVDVDETLMLVFLKHRHCHC